MIICHTVRETCHMMDVIVTFYFGLFFALLPTPNSPKNKNFKKMKNTPGDVTILHNCSKNHDHMLYCSWDMAHDGCNCYFSFWAFFFLLFYLQQFKKHKKTAQKIKISKNEKSTRRYHFTGVPKIMIRWWLLRYGAQRTDGPSDRRTDGRTEKRDI